MDGNDGCDNVSVDIPAVAAPLVYGAASRRAASTSELLGRCGTPIIERDMPPYSQLVLRDGVGCCDDGTARQTVGFLDLGDGLVAPVPDDSIEV